MDIVSITIQLHFKACPRQEYGKGRWIEPETRLVKRSGK